MSTAALQENFPVPIILTENAARKVWELIEEEGNTQLMLRAFITGGGCSGFQYGFTFDDKINPDDTVIEKNIKKTHAANEAMQDDADTVIIKLVVDATSFQYLVGAEIDYKADLEGEQFVIRNPNAKTTCGCGSSFAA